MDDMCSPQPLPVTSKTQTICTSLLLILSVSIQVLRNSYSFLWIPRFHTFFFPLFLPSNPDYLPPSIQSFLLLIKIVHSASGLSAPPASWLQPAPHFGCRYPEPLSQAPHVHVHVHGLLWVSACALAPSWPVYNLLAFRLIFSASPSRKSSLVTAHLQPQMLLLCPPRASFLG